jgi:hypothetical protein
MTSFFCASRKCIVCLSCNSVVVCFFLQIMCSDVNVLNGLGVND